MGSNVASAFAESTYDTDTDWTSLNPASTQMQEPAFADQADPRYILVAPAAAYRYYAFKCADNWGSTAHLGVRRIVLQI